jgi:hypothetical protein
MNDKTTIPLTHVPRELGKLVRDRASVPNYRKIYNAVLDGSICADQLPNGRYQVSSNLRPIIEHFGLAKKIG